MSPCVIFTAPKSGKNVLTCSGINEAGSNVPIEMQMLRLHFAVLLLSANDGENPFSISQGRGIQLEKLVS